MTAILGGGIAGLSAAYYALEAPKMAQLILLEGSNRLGGWIRTENSKSGAIFEKGPRTIRPAGAAGLNTLRMIDDLHLADSIIPVASSHPSSKNRLIYANKKLHSLPNSVASLFTINSPFQRPLVSVVLNDMNAAKGNGDESMYSFVDRRFGRDIADYLISPMLCGICAGDAKKISVNFMMKSLVDMEQKYGSVFKGLVREIWQELLKSKKEKTNSHLSSRKDEEVISASAERARKEKWAVWGLEGGLEKIPQAIEEKLRTKNVDIRLNAQVRNIKFEDGFVELDVGGKIEKFERVISGLSASRLGRILETQHPELSRELSEIPAVTVAVINFEFPGKVLPKEAFGFLVPPMERIPILGVIFDSCVFPQKSSTVLTVMMGGAWFHDYFGDNPSEDIMESVALEQLREILGINVHPVDSHFQILENCIPQYVVGHDERVNRIRNYIIDHKLPLTLCGSSYQGVGLNDVILSAKQSVYDMA